MEEIKRRLSIDNILKYLIMFMILFLSFMVVTSIIKKEFYIDGVVIGIMFIFFLIFIKGLIK